MTCGPRHRPPSLASAHTRTQDFFMRPGPPTAPPGAQTSLAQVGSSPRAPHPSPRLTPDQNYSAALKAKGTQSKPLEAPPLLKKMLKPPKMFPLHNYFPLPKREHP